MGQQFEDFRNACQTPHSSKGIYSAKHTTMPGPIPPASDSFCYLACVAVNSQGGIVLPNAFYFTFIAGDHCSHILAYFRMLVPSLRGRPNANLTLHKPISGLPLDRLPKGLSEGDVNLRVAVDVISTVGNNFPDTKNVKPNKISAIVCIDDDSLSLGTIL